MTLAEVKTKIEKVEKALKNENTPEDTLPDLKAKLKSLKDDLIKLEEEDAQLELLKKEAEELAKKQPENAVKVKKKLEALTEEELSGCDGIADDIQKILEQYLDKKATNPKPRKPPVKRKASEIVSTGVSNVIRRVVNMELSKDDGVKIKVDGLKKTKDSFVCAFKELRKTLGGISSDNNTFIKDFEAEIDELIKKVEAKQEKAA